VPFSITIGQQHFEMAKPSHLRDYSSAAWSSVAADSSCLFELAADWRDWGNAKL
jgi:hypothetical protein